MRSLTLEEGGEDRREKVVPFLGLWCVRCTGSSGRLNILGRGGRDRLSRGSGRGRGRCGGNCGDLGLGLGLRLGRGRLGCRGGLFSSGRLDGLLNLGSLDDRLCDLGFLDLGGDGCLNGHLLNLGGDHLSDDSRIDLGLLGSDDLGNDLGRGDCCNFGLDFLGDDLSNNLSLDLLGSDLSNDLGLDLLGSDLSDDLGLDLFGHDLSDDLGLDLFGDDLSDDLGLDLLGHDLSNDLGLDLLGSDLSDDLGLDLLGDDLSDDLGLDLLGSDLSDDLGLDLFGDDLLGNNDFLGRSGSISTASRSLFGGRVGLYHVGLLLVWSFWEKGQGKGKKKGWPFFSRYLLGVLFPAVPVAAFFFCDLLRFLLVISSS